MLAPIRSALRWSNSLSALPIVRENNVSQVDIMLGIPRNLVADFDNNLAGIVKTFWETARAHQVKARLVARDGVFISSAHLRVESEGKLWGGDLHQGV